LIKVWDIQKIDNSPISEIKTNSLGFCKATFFKDSNGNTLMGCANDLEKSIDIWSISEKKRINSISISDENGKIGMCMSLDCWQSSSGVLMFGGGFENGNIYVWDFRNLSGPYFKLEVQDQSSKNIIIIFFSCFFNLFYFMFFLKILVLSFRIDGQSGKGICGSTGTKIVMFEIEYSSKPEESKSIIEKYKINSKEELNNGGISECSIRNDKKIMATCGWDHRIRIFDFQNSKPLAILKGHSESVSTVKFAPIGNLIASGSKDNRIGLWKIY